MFSNQGADVEQEESATEVVLEQAEPPAELPSESPLESDTLSSAWIIQISKPLDEVLAARQVSSQKLEEGAPLPSKGLGSPPRAAIDSVGSEETGSDPHSGDRARAIRANP